MAARSGHAASAGSCRPDTPPPGHRNAIECPQCDRWTWRATEKCVLCRYNLFAHYERVEQERQAQREAWERQRRERVREQMGMWALGGFAGGLVLTINSDWVPESIRQWVFSVGLVMLVGAGLILKALSDDR